MKNNGTQQQFGKMAWFSAKFNGSYSIELLCKTEHLCFGFRHFAKLQNVTGNAIQNNL